MPILPQLLKALNIFREFEFTYQLVNFSGQRNVCHMVHILVFGLFALLVCSLLLLIREHVPVPWGLHGDQRTTFGSQLSLSVL